MKKLLLSATILAGIAQASVAASWPADVENYAKGCAVTVSTRPEQAHVITNDNDGDRWQAIGGANATNPDWFMIDLGQVRDLSEFQIIWEASHPTAYDVYVSETAIPYSATGDANVIDASWIASHTGIGRTVEGNAGATDYFTNRTKGQYVLVYGREYNGNATTYGSSCFEMRVGYVEPYVPTATSVKLSLEGNIESWVGKTENVSATVLDQKGLAMADAEATLSLEGPGTLADGVYTATATGISTITATYGSLSASATIDVIVDPANYVMGSAVITIDGSADNDQIANITDGGATPTANGNIAILGNENTVGEAIHEVLIDLKAPMALEGIYLTWEGASSNQYTVAVSSDNQTFETVGEIDEAPAILARKDWFRPSDTHQMKGVRYIRVKSTSNGTVYGLKLYEAKAYGTPDYTPVAASVSLASDITLPYVGESITLSATAIDQYDREIAAPTVIYSAPEADGSFDGNIFTPAHKGEITITAKVDGQTAEIKVNAAADKAEIINGSNENIKATVTYTKPGETEQITEEMAGVVDGNADNNGQEAQIGQGTDAIILIDLGGPHNIDMVSLYWETASAADYTIKAWGENQEEPSDAIFTFNRQGSPANPVDRFSNPEAMKSVRYIRIHTTRDATQWQKRLYDVKIFGQRDIIPVSLDIKPYVTIAGDDYSNIAVLYTGEVLNLNPVVTDNFGDIMENPAMTWTDGENVLTLTDNLFTANEAGAYSLKGSIGDLDATVEFSVVDTDQTVKYIHKGVTIEIDNNSENDPYRDIIMGGSHDGITSLDVAGRTVTVRFADEVALSAIETMWESAVGSYTISINGDDAFSMAENAELLHRFDMTAGSGATDQSIRRQISALPGKVTSIVLSGITPAEGSTKAMLSAIVPYTHPDANYNPEDKTTEDLRNEGIATGIATIGAESGTGAPVEYFNLQGMRIDNPAAGTVVIRREGNKVTKTVM